MGALRETAIFNHLLITIKVHNTPKPLEYNKNFEKGTDTRIVGFEVTPLSLPYGTACTDNMLMHGRGKRQILMPDEPFQFSYSYRVVQS